MQNGKNEIKLNNWSISLTNYIFYICVCYLSSFFLIYYVNFEVYPAEELIDATTVKMNMNGKI